MGSEESQCRSDPSTTVFWRVPKDLGKYLTTAAWPVGDPSQQDGEDCHGGQEAEGESEDKSGEGEGGPQGAQPRKRGQRSGGWRGMGWEVFRGYVGTVMSGEQGPG